MPPSGEIKQVDSRSQYTNVNTNKIVPCVLYIFKRRTGLLG